MQDTQTYPCGQVRCRPACSCVPKWWDKQVAQKEWPQGWSWTGASSIPAHKSHTSGSTWQLAGSLSGTPAAALTVWEVTVACGCCSGADPCSSGTVLRSWNLMTVLSRSGPCMRACSLSVQQNMPAQAGSGNAGRCAARMHSLMTGTLGFGVHAVSRLDGIMRCTWCVPPCAGNAGNITLVISLSPTSSSSSSPSCSAPHRPRVSPLPLMRVLSELLKIVTVP